MKDDEKPLCPICRDCRLETARFSKQIEVGGTAIEVHELECWLCLDCGATPEFDDQRKRNQQRLELAIEKHKRATPTARVRMTLYTHPRSRGRIARWMLEEVGADYDVQILEYGEAMQTATYRAINPMCKVPTLVDGAAVVTECAAICAYLADRFPASRLAPPHHQRADYYRWLFFAAGPLEAAIVNQALGVELKPEQQGFVGYGDLARVLDVLETLVTQREFIASQRFSAADLYLAAQLNFGLQFGTIEKRDAFEAYVARIIERDAYRRAAQLDDAGLPIPSSVTPAPQSEPTE